MLVVVVGCCWLLLVVVGCCWLVVGWLLVCCCLLLYICLLLVGWLDHSVVVVVVVFVLSWDLLLRHPLCSDILFLFFYSCLLSCCRPTDCLLLVELIRTLSVVLECGMSQRHEIVGMSSVLLDIICSLRYVKYFFLSCCYCSLYYRYVKIPNQNTDQNYKKTGLEYF